MIDAKQFWDKAAKKYAKAPIENMEAYLQTLERTKNYLSSDDNVLELGCGTGSTAILLAGHVNHITANDLSTQMIAIAREKTANEGIDNIDFVAADLYEAKFDTTPFDVVLAHNVLHLIEDTQAAIKQIHSLVKPDGIFISKTFCQLGKGISFKYKLIKMILPIMQAFGKAPYVKFRPAGELNEIIEKQGFEIIEFGDYPSRYIVARKL